MFPLPLQLTYLTLKSATHKHILLDLTHTLQRLKTQLHARTPYDLTDVNFMVGGGGSSGGKKKGYGKDPVCKHMECKEAKGEGTDDSFDHTIGFLVSEISTRGRLPLPQISIYLFICLFSLFLLLLLLSYLKTSFIHEGIPLMTLRPPPHLAATSSNWGTPSSQSQIGQWLEDSGLGMYKQVLSSSLLSLFFLFSNIILI